ncbi:hypothetical protein KM043_014889 [Ampulex compressa]|nr:hypothetical protein KM043_014889 [Ampulex compressa]
MSRGGRLLEKVRGSEGGAGELYLNTRTKCPAMNHCHPRLRSPLENPPRGPALECTSKRNPPAIVITTRRAARAERFCRLYGVARKNRTADPAERLDELHHVAALSAGNKRP